VRAVALPAFIDISTGTIPIASLAKGNTLPATPQSVPDKDTSSDFLALLLAGLGFESEPQVPPETASVSGSLNPQRGAPKKSNVAPVKEKQAEQSTGVALLPPFPVATTQTRMPRLMPETTLEFQKPDDLKGGENGSDAIAVAGDVSRGMVPQKATPAAAPEPAAPEPASSPEIASSSASTKAVPEGPGPAQTPQSQAEIAFEAQIELRASDDPDQTALAKSNETAEEPEAVKQAIRTDNAEEVAPVVSPGSRPEPVMQAARTAAEQPQDHTDAPRADPVRSPQDRTIESNDGKLSPDAATSQDSGGQEQQDLTASKKQAGQPSEGPSDNMPVSPDSPSSGGPVVAVAPASSSQAAAVPKAEPSPDLTASDTEADGAPSPSPGGTRAKDIAIQLQDPGGPRVDVQLSDRAGTVHVVVRTPDDGLAKDLRTNLPDLAQKLNQQGIDGDAWSPVETRNTAGEQQNPRQAHEQTGGNSQSSHGRDPGGRNREQDQQQHPGSEDEFEQSLSGALTGVTTWQPTR
jgi:hypothetical protein